MICFLLPITAFLLSFQIPLMVYLTTTQHHALSEEEASVPDLRTLDRKLGNTHDLSHVEVRAAYHDALDFGQKVLPQLTSVTSEEGKARRCHLHRWRARIWARQRGGEWVTWYGFRLLPPKVVPFILGIRDVFTHAITFKTITTHPPSIYFRDAGSCLVQDPDRPFCPSIDSLLLKHKGNWSRIGESCYNTNKYYDKLVGHEKPAAAAGSRKEGRPSAEVDGPLSAPEEGDL